MKKPKIAVLTTFHEWVTSYSLVSVVESQLVSLVKNGYEPVLFTLESFKDDKLIPKGVEVRRVIPQVLLTDYSDFKEPESDFDVKADAIYKALKENTEDIDVIFEHDLIFQGWFLPHAAAIHRLSRETDIKWFHWLHSVPSPRPADVKMPHMLRYLLPKNSKLVYLNNVHLIRAAEAYGVFPKDVRVVYNPVDPRMFWQTHPFVNKVIEEYDILSADYLAVYPVSTTRMVDGKQVKVVVDVMSELKKLRRRVSLVICNAHANDKREKEIISDVLSYANQKGLSSNEVIFTSLVSAPNYELGVPRKVVSDLLHLSNIFIFPSISENCSLILLEAMLSKNLLVLNENQFLPFREFAGDTALYFDFGSLVSKIEYANRDQFMADVARIIDSEMGQNKTLRAATLARQNYNIDTIFRRQIEPLLYE